MHGGVEEGLEITCVEFGDASLERLLDGGRLASVVMILATCKPGFLRSAVEPTAAGTTMSFIKCLPWPVIAWDSSPAMEGA